MSQSDILKKIHDDAVAQIRALRADFESRKKGLETESVKIEKEELAAQQKKFDAAAAAVESEMKIMARRENDQMMMETKKEVLDEAVAALEKYMISLPESELENLFARAIEALPFEKGKIFAAKKYASLLQKITPNSFEVVADESINFGFVARHGSLSVETTLDSLLHSEFREPVRGFLAQRLKI